MGCCFLYMCFASSLDSLHFQAFSFEKDCVDKDFDAHANRRSVILIRNGKKSYGSGKTRKEVLKDINMTISEGAM
jgi:hypothetical protein